MRYLFGISRTSPNSSYSMWKTLEKEFCNESWSGLLAWGRPGLGLMLLGSGEGKHLHVESRFGQDSNHEKTFFHGVLPVCFLAVSTSSSPPTRQLQLKATSRGWDSSCEQEQKEHWSITHHVLPEGEFMSAFLHSCLPFRFPLIGTCFLFNLYSQHLAKDRFSIFKEVGTGCWGWTRPLRFGKKKKVAPHARFFCPHTHTQMSAHLHSCPRNEPWSI